MVKVKFCKIFNYQIVYEIRLQQDRCISRIIESV